MTGELTGQIAVVTGAGRGIGRALAIRFAQAGCEVAAVARTDGQLRETVEIIEAAGGLSIYVVADVTNPHAVQAMVQSVQADLGPIDLLINNAGRALAIGPIWEADPDEWWLDIETNLRGAFLCCRAVIPEMLVRQRGRIINIASGHALGPSPYFSAYSSSKAALLRLTDCLANELTLQEAGVRVFAVSPGMVETRMTEYLFTSDAGRKWLPQLANVPRGTTDRVVELAVLLASGSADVLSGRFIQIADNVLEMVQHVEKIRQQGLYSLRLHKLPEPNRP